MKALTLGVVSVTFFNESFWIVLISSPVRSLHASTVLLFEDEVFALTAGAAFVFVTTTGGELAAGAGATVCI